MTRTTVDFAAKLISPQAIKDAGHEGVMVYVSPSRPGSNFAAKPIQRAFTNECRSIGLNIVSIWQFGKPGNAQAPSDWTTGFEGGQRMATEAQARHLQAGGPDHAPIFFAVDEDLSIDNWNRTAVEFFRGVNSVLGVQRTGVYGSSKVCSWAVEDGVIGRSRTHGRFWAWQTRAWSGGELSPEAVLFQRVIDTPSNPGPLIDGASVDVNDIWADDYGQWSDKAPEGPSMAQKPDFQEIDRFGNSRSNRFNARVTNWLIHTQEGNGTAESLAGYLNNQANGVSYHYTVRDGVVVNVVDTDYASWSVLDANSYTINLCFAGSYASWTREQWLEREHDIRIAAWLAVQDAKKYGFSVEVIAPPYHQAPGISDHRYVTEELGIGTHTDVGRNFPWDVLARFVAEYTEAGPIRVPNAINDCEAANAWLGERFTKEELRTPDGKGRFVQYDNGFIYWSPDSGAHPIPKDLFPKFGDLGWEVGPLGYPTTDPTKLTDGWVQGFQGGALYKKLDQPARWVHGEIRNRWNRTGFENGPLGWPTSDEFPFGDGAAQDFEKGRIYWAPKPTVVVLADGSGLKDAA